MKSSPVNKHRHAATQAMAPFILVAGVAWHPGWSALVAGPIERTFFLKPAVWSPD